MRRLLLLAAAPGGRPEPWLGICGGSWATLQWQSTRIQARIQTTTALNLDIEQARRTLARLEAATWGIALPGDQGGAVRGAAGRRAGRSALDRGRPAGREAVELVNELTTALEQQLTKALRALSWIYCKLLLHNALLPISPTWFPHYIPLPEREFMRPRETYADRYRNDRLSSPPSAWACRYVFPNARCVRKP